MVPLLQRLTLEKPQSKQRALPRLSAPRLGSVFPHSGIAPRAAAMGHPWPSAANPASCRVTHAPKPAFGQRGLMGRLRSRSKADQEHSGLPAGLSVEEQNQKPKRARFKCGSWLACDGITSVYLKNRGVCIAGKPAPTEEPGSTARFALAFDFFAFASTTQVGFQAAVLLILILGAPLNHAGRTQALERG